MERHQLREAILILCQEYGFTNANTYEKLDELIDTIEQDSPDDAPRICILTGADGENADDCTTHDHES